MYYVFFLQNFFSQVGAVFSWVYGKERLCAGFVFPSTPLGQLGSVEAGISPTRGQRFFLTPPCPLLLFLPFRSFVAGVCQLGLQLLRLGAGVGEGLGMSVGDFPSLCFSPWPEAQCGWPAAASSTRPVCQPGP